MAAFSDDSCSRRRFLETAFTATVLAVATPGMALGRVVPVFSRSSDGALAGTYTLKLSETSGLTATPSSLLLQVKGVSGRVIVSRTAESTFVAVNNRCSHQGNAVGTLDLQTLRFTCPAHQSVFEADGTYVSGPADGVNLTKYPVLFDGVDTLKIEIPGFVSAVDEEGHLISFLAPPVVSPDAASCTLRYGIASRSHVIVTVTSADGAAVIRPVDDVREAGEHTASFDISRLPSGVYFCRIDSTGGFLDTRKFVIRR